MKKFIAENRRLVLRLVIPFALLSVLFIWLSVRLPDQSIFINLGTDFISIIITILYVNWVVQEQEKIKWNKAEVYISGESSSIGLELIAELADLTHLTYNIYPESGIQLAEQGQLEGFLQLIKENVRRVERKTLIHELKKFGVKEWDKLIEVLQKSHEQSSVFLNLYSNRINPEQLETLLRFREATSGMIGVYKTFRVVFVMEERGLRKKAEVKSQTMWLYSQ